MSTLGNLFWVLFGGWILAALWTVAGILLSITIIGIPAGMSCFKIAGFVLVPFGRKIVYSGKISSIILNVIWILVFGWELAVLSLVIGILWCITVVGIPFGIQFIKLAQVSIMPFGAQIVRA